MLKRKKYALLQIALSVTLMLSACGGTENRVKVFPFLTDRNAESFDALVDAFKEEHPNIQFINVAETIGPGVEPQFFLDTLIQAGDPPDSWQGYAGQALMDEYVADKQIQPLNDLYGSDGWRGVFPENLLPLISQGGNLYSVPIGVHRINVLWYNPVVLDANGISVPKSMNEWFLAMDAIKAAGVVPLAIGDQETRLLLLETILLSSLGPKKYKGLWSGSTGWDNEDVTAALEAYEVVLTYANGDPDALSWQESTELVVNGNAAFTVMGDWAHGYFRERGKVLNTDYGWAAVPGTEGTFQFYADSFVLAENSLSEKGGLAWLQFVGSREGQETYNARTDSICARIDCDTSLFDEYARASMTHWSSDILVGSLSYGVVANDAWRAEIESALAAFLLDEDVDLFQSALVAACQNSGPCP